MVAAQDGAALSVFETRTPGKGIIALPPIYDLDGLAPCCSPVSGYAVERSVRSLIDVAIATLVGLLALLETYKDVVFLIQAEARGHHLLCGFFGIKTHPGPRIGPARAVVFGYPQPGSVVTGIEGCASIFMRDPVKDFRSNCFDHLFTACARVCLPPCIKRMQSIALYVVNLAHIGADFFAGRHLIHRECTPWFLDSSAAPLHQAQG